MSKGRHRGIYEAKRLKHAEWAELCKLISPVDLPIASLSPTTISYGLASEQLFVDVLKSEAVSSRPITASLITDYFMSMHVRDRMVRRLHDNGIVVVRSLMEGVNRSPKLFNVSWEASMLPVVSGRCSRCLYWNLLFFMTSERVCIPCSMFQGVYEIELATGDLINVG